MNFNQIKKTALVWGLIIGLIIPVLANQTQTSSELLTDGPYVFYLNNKIISCSLTNSQLKIKEYSKGKPIKLIVPAVKELTVDIPVILPKPGGEVFKNVSNVFAISDVHGQFYRMKDILIGNNIMDKEYNWIFKKGHLVLVGDVLDRGPMATECLWLLYRLEQQAEKKGGKVHMLLGNHDQMVIRADLRYVHKRYKKITKKLKRIHYQDLFGPDTFLGLWLRSRPATVKINDVLYVHAGVHPYLVEKKMPMADINNLVRRHLDSRSYVLAFNPLVSFIFGRNGVFWSRGYFNGKGYLSVNRDQLIDVLKFYKASHVVVGHTRFDHVQAHLGGLLFSVAVNTEDDKPAEGLLIKNNHFYNADVEGNLKEIKF